MIEECKSQKDLIGKIFQHEWTNGKYKGVIYQVEFLSDIELRWTGLAGFPAGKSDIQNYSLLEIDQNIYNFSWLANDGLCVSIIYNLNNMSAFGVISDSKEQNVLTGILKIIK